MALHALSIFRPFWNAPALESHIDSNTPTEKACSFVDSEMGLASKRFAFELSQKKKPLQAHFPASSLLNLDSETWSEGQFFHKIIF